MLEREIPKTILHVPNRPRRTAAENAAHALRGGLLGPAYWLLASLRSAPGLGFRGWAFGLGLRALLQTSRRLSLRTIFHLLFMPMESTRYFEFDFVRQALVQRSIGRYLDISSPRIMPIYLLDKLREMRADLVNPDAKDLAETQRFVDSVGAGKRCTVHCCTIDNAPFAAETFDLITSVSVLEHIPEDVQAVRKMWELLKPGGLLILTVPCMVQASEQYIDQYLWGVLEENREGLVFWQRFYDRRLLEENVFSITGLPRLATVFGERTAGSLAANSERKRSDHRYPYWREPYMMAIDYKFFGSVDELPGEGVIGLVFSKP